MACIADFYIIDDQIIKTEEFDISFLEKGFTIYEVVKVIEGIPLFFNDHIVRLHLSAKLKEVNINYTDEYIKKNVFRLIQINNIQSGRLKFGIRYHSFTDKFISFFLEKIEPPREVYKTGIEIISEKHERKSPNAKVINYLLRKRVKSIINESNAFETLLVNRNEKITECSKSNIFFIKDETVYTSFRKDVLAGITRDYVFKACKELDINIVEKDIYYFEIHEFESAFISGTSIGILSAVKIDDFYFERENKILNLLSKTYHELTKQYIEDYKESNLIKSSSSKKR